MARILIVEDEPKNVEILTRLLQRQKYEYQVAGTADVARTLAHDWQPDLILMDLGIPLVAGGDLDRVGGLQVTRDLKDDAATARIPVIAVTASTMPDDVERIRNAGCAAAVAKPYEFSELLQAIQHQLKLAQQ